MSDSVTGSAYLGRLVPYERWRTPFNETERRNALLSGPAILLGGILDGVLLAAGPYWLVSSGFLLALSWALIAADAAALVTYALLCLNTGALSQPASGDWHDAAFAVSIVGAINASLVALVVAAAVIIAVISIIVAVLVGVAALAALLGGAGSSE